MRTITNPAALHIQPRNIPVTRHYFGSFGRAETETSAQWIVEFCKERCQSWAPFSIEELEEYYHRYRPVGEEFRFNGLDTRGFIVLKGGRYHLTEEFVERCHESATRRH